MKITEQNTMFLLARLSKSPEFQQFTEQYLVPLMERELDQCVTDENPARSQGAVTVLREMIEDIEGAELAYLKMTGRHEVELPPAPNSF